MRLLERSRIPNVIAPAWKAFRHRETILQSFVASGSPPTQDLPVSRVRNPTH